MSSRTVETRLGEASAQISAARAALAEGRPLVLDGLVEHVDRVCRDLAALPNAEATVFKSRLLTILDDLNGLAGTLTREHDALKHALKDLSTHQRAQSAYGKATGGGS